ncbi:type II toxin-antitoxin system RelE/ParE family toxin [Frankia sp. CIT1]|uniref:type II toxin-antitoxin system RelE/ParE family toxin n=2 Tax=unclassified Frankia TaxID=2632575 RepID=UPI00351D5330
MKWAVILVDEVDEWFMGLVRSDPRTAELVTAAIDQLVSDGPALGRPYVDSIQDSKIHNMKELRPGSAGGTEVRILFVFDPQRQAVLLVAGDKSGQRRRWYEVNIPLAEQRYQRWLDGDYGVERSWRVMARTWEEVRTEAVATGLLGQERIDAIGVRMRAETRAHRLADIRRTYGLDQGEVAERIGVSQSRISRIERGDLDHTEIATVRSYIEALGGQVEIVAKFGDERITVG